MDIVYAALFSLLTCIAVFALKKVCALKEDVRKYKKIFSNWIDIRDSKIVALLDRVEALERVSRDVGLTQESARKAAEEMERFNAGVSAILNYDGEAKKR